LAAELDKAIADFNRAMSAVAELGLTFAQRLVRSYLLWCELLHPARGQAAIAFTAKENGERTPTA
jgi:hypothetical protein